MTLSEFVSSEVERYEAEGHNQLLAAAAGATRCEQYVEEIVKRYTIAARTHSRMLKDLMDSLKPGQRTLSAEQLQMFAAANHQVMLLHLEIESFYLFAKILLDRTAHLMHWWFAGTRMARGISINRHSDVVDHLGELIAAGQLVAPEGILELASALQARISDYRDREITHDPRHAFSGTTYTADGKATIMKVHLGAGVKGQLNAGESEHIEELNDLRERYVDLAMQFLARNRDKAKLYSLRKSG